MNLVNVSFLIGLIFYDLVIDKRQVLLGQCDNTKQTRLQAALNPVQSTAACIKLAKLQSSGQNILVQVNASPGKVSAKTQDATEWSECDGGLHRVISQSNTCSQSYDLIVKAVLGFIIANTINHSIIAWALSGFVYKSNMINGSLENLQGSFLFGIIGIVLLMSLSGRDIRDTFDIQSLISSGSRRRSR